MKMTMHIDEELLDRVIRAHGFASKTEAVEMALRELDRKARFRTLVGTGLGLTADELGAAVDPDYDVLALRVGEDPGPYGRAARSAALPPRPEPPLTPAPEAPRRARQRRRR